MDTDIYSALGNEVRIKLLLCLSSSEKTVTELIQNCGLSQSAVSQHLQKLRGCGMVQVRRDGREKYYSVPDQDLVTICTLIQQFVNKKKGTTLYIS